MEIGEIKTKLSITNVLAHYGITTIKNKQINCPFHNDKIPSPALRSVLLKNKYS